MDEQQEEWPKFRILFQYFNPAEAGPSFQFTTVEAPNEELARQWITEGHAGDANFEIGQVVPANDFTFGYTYDDVKAQRTPDQIAWEEKRLALDELLARGEAGRENAAGFDLWTDALENVLYEVGRIRGVTPENPKGAGDAEDPAAG